MDDVLKLMIKIYGVHEYDWMNFKITKTNPLTYHHIKKEAVGGKRTFENGAPLTELAHRYLHQIEEKDKGLFGKISRQLQRINDNKGVVTSKDIKIIQSAMLEYERKYDYELRKRIKDINYNPQTLRSIKGSRDIFSPTNVRLVMQNGINPTTYDNKKKRKTKKK